MFVFIVKYIYYTCAYFYTCMNTITHVHLTVKQITITKSLVALSFVYHDFFSTQVNVPQAGSRIVDDATVSWEELCHIMKPITSVK